MAVGGSGGGRSRMGGRAAIAAVVNVSWLVAEVIFVGSRADGSSLSGHRSVHLLQREPN